MPAMTQSGAGSPAGTQGGGWEDCVGVRISEGRGDSQRLPCRLPTQSLHAPPLPGAGGGEKQGS